MATPSHSTQAFGLGAASGLRTFGALGPLGARGRLAGQVGRIAFPILLAGELAGDKHPSIPPRSDPPALAGLACSPVGEAAMTRRLRGSCSAPPRGR